MAKVGVCFLDGRQGYYVLVSGHESLRIAARQGLIRWWRRAAVIALHWRYGLWECRAERGLYLLCEVIL